MLTLFKRLIVDELGASAVEHWFNSRAYCNSDYSNGIFIGRQTYEVFQELPGGLKIWLRDK